ncbi:MAG TPA: hypothetical protein ENI23_07740 [bacterium]|nr:hypothetical protein [bacterium]
MGCDHEREKLFGEDKWEVEEAARTLTKSEDLETRKPKVYLAAIKYLERKQGSIAKVIRAAKKTKGIK